MCRARAYFRQPMRSKNIFTMPFSKNAWTGIIVFFIFIISIISILTWTNHNLHSGPWYSAESFLLIITVVSQKGNLAEIIWSSLFIMNLKQWFTSIYMLCRLVL